MLRVTCIIPSSGSEKSLPCLKKCLRSLEKSSKNIAKLTLILVSSSSDVRPKLLHYRIDNFYLVNQNLGFAGMINLAVVESLGFYDSDYYLLINDDAWIRKDFFKNLEGLVTPKEYDVIIPLIFSSRGNEIDSFGLEYFASGYVKNASFISEDSLLGAGACLFIKTIFLRKVGGVYGFYFNSLLYSYLEDAEFSIRALGIGAAFKKSKRLIAYHVGSLSYGRKSSLVMFYTYRNILWVMIMTWPLRAFIMNAKSIVLLQTWIIIDVTFSQGILSYLRILLDTLTNIDKLLIYRKKIVSKYDRTFNFSSITSKFAFRTNRGFAL